ncbi:MAG: ATP-binding protein [Vicinamibacterales bacterium]
MAVAFGAAVTRLTWPFFGATPFVPLFGAVMVATHWGGGPPGLLAIALSVAALGVAYPAGTIAPWEPHMLLVFLALSLLGNRVMYGRNRMADVQRQAQRDLRQSEAKLRQAQKMEAVGQLVAGVAHNFNNLLTVTMGYTDILIERHRDNPLDRAELGHIQQATERGAALVRQLLAFARKHDRPRARIDLNRAVDGLRDMLDRVTREDVHLTIEPVRPPVAISLDPGDLEQIILNLAMNARDAMPAGGELSIEVARATVEASQIPPDFIAQPGEYARLRVRDNGVGMTPEVRSHLFEPFFTTKEVGEGTGLGLAFIHGVVNTAGGFVTVETAPGQGTSVAIFLPVATAESEAAVSAPTADRAEPAVWSGTILLVEDEHTVREMTGRMLRRAGYQVIAAEGPKEALALFEQRGRAIDLLVTDVVMPDMHGPELADRIASLKPDLRVLFVSGYADAMPPIGDVSGRAFLAKPFPPVRLVAAVGELLGAPTA